MGSTAFFKAALAAIVCSLIFITPSFAQLPDGALENAKAFIGTWDSSRTNLCGPCTLKIDSFDERGKAIGTLTTYPSGVTTLDAMLKLNSRDKVVLAITAPLGSYIELEIPKKGAGRMYGTFSNGREIGFKRQ